MKELSELLKSERLKQGLTLKAASERAHVSANVLQFLEEAQYERIGTPLLIRSFIKAYCSALGIDPMPLLEKHEREILSYDWQDDGIKQYGVWAKALHRKGRRGILLVLLLVLAVVAALYGNMWLSMTKARLSSSQGATGGIYTQQELPVDLRKETSSSGDAAVKKDVATPSTDQSLKLSEESLANKAENADAPAVVGKTLDSTPAVNPGAEGANSAEVLAEDKPEGIVSQEPVKHRLEVEASQKTWIQIKIDGKRVQNATLRSGDKRGWEAESNIQVVVGNGGGVTMKWDGQALATKGKPGRILRLNLPLSEVVRKPTTP